MLTIFNKIATIPLDTAKVRLQIQGQRLQPGETAKYKGLLNTVAVIIKEEGVRAPYKGLFAGLQRQMVYASLRIGLYDPIKSVICGRDFKGEVPLYKRILSGLTSGAIAILVANPTDVIKIRLQAEGNLPPGVQKRYSGAMYAWMKIYRNEGYLYYRIYLIIYMYKCLKVEIVLDGSWT